MLETREPIAQFLIQLLSATAPAPELGARLKQRLNAALISNGFAAFNEKSLGFRKFSDYLQQVHSNLVSIERRDGGDIYVTLRASSSSQSIAPATVTQARASSAPVVRSAVWQAFANPDTERKRFLNKDTGHVVHFLVGKSSPAKLQVESDADRYVEIQPIPADVQMAWMREFLGSAPISPVAKQTLEPLVAEQYSSTVNATFSRALGEQGGAWRAFRTARVIEIIYKWADDTQVNTELLHVNPVVPSSVQFGVINAAHQSSAPRNVNEHASPQQVSPREQVSKLLELLTDDDISRLVLPTLLSTILIKSRL